MTACQCKTPGWCQRHAVMKSQRWWELCQSNETYFQAWEDGKGPGQHIPLERRVPKRIPLNVPVITEGRVEFITLAQLAEDSVTLASLLPSDVDAIVAVPRSGMIPASIVACMLHLPLLTIVDGAIVPCGSGARLRKSGTPQKMAFIDDTLAGGTAYRKLVDTGLLTSPHVFGVVYSSVPEGDHLFTRHLPFPHLLEWNLFNSGYTQSFASDLDGIICCNPPNPEVPWYLPRKHAIKAIITARPVSECVETMSWLEAKGVKYERLFMWPLQSESADAQAISEWKAKTVRACGAEWYVESEPGLANMIRTHGIRVLCPRQGYLV